MVRGFVLACCVVRGFVSLGVLCGSGFCESGVLCGSGFCEFGVLCGSEFCEFWRVVWFGVL